MNRCFVAIVMLLIFTSCQRPPPRGLDYEDRVLIQFDTDEFSQVVWEYVVELKHDNRLILEEAYVCFGDSSNIRLQFITQHILELCEARALLVDVVEGLLDRINHSKSASAFLDPYPLTADQLEIYINFESYYGIYDDPYYIGWVALEKGMSYFYAFNLKNKTKDFWSVRTEPYFKSRSFVLFEREGEQKYKESHPAKHVMLPERYEGLITTPQIPARF